MNIKVRLLEIMRHIAILSQQLDRYTTGLERYHGMYLEIKARAK
jgi:hypothetical protein